MKTLKIAFFLIIAINLTQWFFVPLEDYMKYGDIVNVALFMILFFIAAIFFVMISSKTTKYQVIKIQDIVSGKERFQIQRKSYFFYWIDHGKAFKKEKKALKAYDILTDSHAITNEAIIKG